MLLSITDRSSLALLVLHKLDQHAHDHNKREANIAVLAPVSVKWVACRTNASPEIPSQSTYGVLSNHSDRPHRKRAVGRYAFCRVLLDHCSTLGFGLLMRGRIFVLLWYRLLVKYLE